MHSLRILAVVAVITFCSSGLHADILGTAEFVHDSCCWGFDTCYSRLLLRLTIGDIMPEVGYWPWDVEFPDWLNDTDIGTVLTATMATQDFPTFVSNMTNNHSNYIGAGFFVPLKAGGVSGMYEIELEPVAFSLSGNDFYGATITSVSLTVEELTLERCTSLLGNDCLGIHCRVTMTVEGEWSAIATESTSWGRIKALYAE